MSFKKLFIEQLENEIRLSELKESLKTLQKCFSFINIYEEDLKEDFIYPTYPTPKINDIYKSNVMERFDNIIEYYNNLKGLSEEEKQNELIKLYHDADFARALDTISFLYLVCPKEEKQVKLKYTVSRNRKELYYQFVLDENETDDLIPPWLLNLKLPKDVFKLIKNDLTETDIIFKFFYASYYIKVSIYLNEDINKMNFVFRRDFTNLFGTNGFQINNVKNKANNNLLNNMYNRNLTIAKEIDDKVFSLSSTHLFYIV